MCLRSKQPGQKPLVLYELRLCWAYGSFPTRLYLKCFPWGEWGERVSLGKTFSWKKGRIWTSPYPQCHHYLIEHKVVFSGLKLSIFQNVLFGHSHAKFSAFCIHISYKWKGQRPNYCLKYSRFLYWIHLKWLNVGPLQLQITKAAKKL